MKVGSRVRKQREHESGYVWPEDMQLGTVIGINNGCNRDGYDYVESVVIRWDNGKVDTSKLTGADEAGDWELKDETPLCYANLYLHDRAYGGPEEGGWWYDTYSPVTAEDDWDDAPPNYGHFNTEAAAKNAMPALEAWCNDQNSRRRSPSSMASEGHFVVRLEAWPAEHDPKQHPHYC